MNKTKLQGLSDLTKQLSKMGLIDNKEVGNIVGNAAELILSSAKQKCKSTTVKRSLGFITKNDSKYPTTKLIGVRGGYGNETITAPALAVILEFGAAERVPKKKEFKKVLIGGKWVTMSHNNPFRPIKARPFLRPALDENKDKAKEMIENGMVTLIEQTAKKNNLI